MARQPRDYKAEYVRRIERSRVRGLTRSQGRGHPRAGEQPISTLTQVPHPVYSPHLEEGLKAIRKGRPLIVSARSLHVAPERLRHYLIQTGVVQKQHGRWIVVNDQRLREVQVFSGGHEYDITVVGYAAAAQVGRYMAAVGHFLESNDPRDLDPFVGQSVTDLRGRQHVFETRPNALYRLDAAQSTSFEQIYRIVV
jgi:hypothetical protein